MSPTKKRIRPPVCAPRLCTGRGPPGDQTPSPSAAKGSICSQQRNFTFCTWILPLGWWAGIRVPAPSIWRGLCNPTPQGCCPGSPSPRPPPSEDTSDVTVLLPVATAAHHRPTQCPHHGLHGHVPRPGGGPIALHYSPQIFLSCCASAQLTALQGDLLHAHRPQPPPHVSPSSAGSSPAACPPREKCSF